MFLWYSLLSPLRGIFIVSHFGMIVSFLPILLLLTFIKVMLLYLYSLFKQINHLFFNQGDGTIPMLYEVLIVSVCARSSLLLHRNKPMPRAGSSETHELDTFFIHYIL